jgi:dTDP-4-dehydrorhamnose reductase
MKQRKILVTGVDGQVGFELVRSLQGLGDIVAADRRTMDLSDVEAIRRVVREVQPDVIVNPAAYTAVDRAETEVDAARQINAVAPAVIAEEAARSGALMVHYSTDYVFDGTKAGAYTETDQTNPRNVYGRTKLEGELAIAGSGCAHLILRTSWVYGLRGRNFLATMLKLAGDRDELRVVSDQFGAPTWSNTIASLTACLLSQGLSLDTDAAWWRARSGIYHMSAGGSTSWAGFANAIFDIALAGKRPRVVPIEAIDYPTPAARPANSVMSHKKLGQVFGLQPPAWDRALRLCLVT